MEPGGSEPRPPARLTIADASAVLGVSPDTVRRRIHAGDIRAERDARGHYLVELSEEQRAGATTGEEARLRVELGHLGELLAEVRHQRETLESQVAGLQRLLELSQEAQSDIRAELARQSKESAEAQERWLTLLGELRELIARQTALIDRLTGLPTSRRI